MIFTFLYALLETSEVEKAKRREYRQTFLKTTLFFFLKCMLMILYLTYVIVLTTKKRDGFVSLMLLKMSWDTKVPNLWKLLYTGNNFSLFLLFAPHLSLCLHGNEGPVHWGESQGSKTRLRDQLGSREEIPFMDHWSASCAPVSLRDIMIEEQVMQDSMEKVIVTHRRKKKSLPWTLKESSENLLCLGFSPGQVGGTWIRKIVQPSWRRTSCFPCSPP